MKRKIRHEWAPLLKVISNDAMDVYNTLEWDADGDNKKIDKVLTKFEEYCEPKKNVLKQELVIYCVNVWNEREADNARERRDFEEDEVNTMVLHTVCIILVILVVFSKWGNKGKVL